ncbi:MAG: carbon storage regulator [Spartobacteria bacterium]|nr:carbon storage regulator [Spartobacteria bacterium]
MLVLTRKSEESVIVGSTIEVKILGIRGDQVSLGFSAPSEISIYRKEVYEEIQRENRQASRLSADELTVLTDSLGKHLAETRRKKQQEAGKE